MTAFLGPEPSSDPLGTTVVDTPSTQPSGKRPFWIGLSAGVAATAAAVGIAFGVVTAVRAASAPGSFDITGMITLTGKTTSSGLPTGFTCAGAGGYSDLSSSAAVTVSDESGTLLAKGHFTGSSGSSGYCIFDFTVTDVPRGSKFYEVEIAHRGGLSFTEAEAENGVALSLGD
ncbi:hypothetical protein AB4Z09_20100 [Rhodococcus sp. TAF43]|uniref:hypothetical protein n=1 Tax=unclassified Rhodococcus (in: high G+C Gram-positive bacteria) TaxID=192944 RepID=UPI0015836954|nr:hypothetical protein [Rhodococcus sp. W8901]QKT10596.1 hypothetical protein HUN07_07570 [Rhodococcus sp. W8901]